jgi:hypothetical protein
MPELTQEQIEEQLILEMQAASARYLAKECNADEYRRTLQRFNDFILRGVVPADLKLPAKPVGSENGHQNGRAKKA